MRQFKIVGSTRAKNATKKSFPIFFRISVKLWILEVSSSKRKNALFNITLDKGVRKLKKTLLSQKL